MSDVQIVFGGGNFTSFSGYKSAEEIEEMLGLIEELGIKTIDTAYVYGESEQWLGENNATSRFVIDTKFPGLVGLEPSTREVVIATGKESLRRLATEQVNVYYIHGPDTRVPIEDTLSGINELYKAGAFRRFGLSNFTADQVEEVIRISKERGYVLPTVYQGNYNAVARRTETEVIPVLRRHNIAFYAYSPIAGGFLAKNPEDLKDGVLKGRWDPESFLGKMYYAQYANRSTTFQSLSTWHEIAAAEGVPAAELAYRWVAHNSVLDGSRGDAVIVGARTADQLSGTLTAIRKGPLSAAAVAKIDAVWESVKHDSALDNTSAFGDTSSFNRDDLKDVFKPQA